MRTLLLAALAALSFASGAAEPVVVTLDVQNMTCSLCPITVRKSLQQVVGVSAVSIDFERKTATVTYDPDQARPEALTDATTHAGYPSTLRR